MEVWKAVVDAPCDL